MGGNVDQSGADSSNLVKDPYMGGVGWIGGGYGCI